MIITDRVRTSRRMKGVPSRPIGDLDKTSASRWECRRSPDCRRVLCRTGRTWARISRLHTAYGVKSR